MNLPKIINSVVLLSILLIFTGCFTKYNLIKTNPYENSKKIAGNINEIIISDMRQNISNREIKIPVMTLPGMKDEISQKLQEFTITLIMDEITKQFSANSDTSYNVEIKLIKGTIGYKANALNEKEFTDIVIEILAKDQFNNMKKFNANVYLEVKSLNASPQYLQILFERGLINAIHKSFKYTDN